MERRDSGQDKKHDRGSKGGKILTIVAIILGIFVAGELIALGIQYLAPESGAAKVIDNITKGFDKDDDSQGEEAAGGITLTTDPDAAASTSTPSPLDMDQVVANQSESHSNSNILSVTSDPTLTFAAGEDYGFDEFSNTYVYTNAVWYTDDNGKEVSYADAMVEELISYYSDYIISDEETAGSTKTKTVKDTKVISNLAIGEIRAGGAGFYIRTAITIADSAADAELSDAAQSADGGSVASSTSGGSGTTVKNQLVYMEPSAEQMKVVSVKDI